MAIIYHFPLETPDDKNLWTKGNVFSLIRFYLWEHPPRPIFSTRFRETAQCDLRELEVYLNGLY